VSACSLPAFTERALRKLEVKGKPKNGLVLFVVSPDVGVVEPLAGGVLMSANASDSWPESAFSVLLCETETGSIPDGVTGVRGTL
jgi:hypothetical protein